MTQAHIQKSHMKPIYSELCASISDLKKSPTALLKESKGMPIAILNHNTPTAYFMDAKVYEVLIEMIDDIELSRIVEERKNDKVIEVTLDDL